MADEDDFDAGGFENDAEIEDVEMEDDIQGNL